MGALAGALTNMVNGAVSPLYFRNVLRWHDVEAVWRAAVTQGIFEALLHGIHFAAVFATVFGIVTRGECPWSGALAFLLCVFVAVPACWVLGGHIAMGLATLGSEFYRRTFAGVPEETGPMLRYAWVGGSIWGAMFGGLLAATLGSVIFRNRWKKHLAEATPAATP